MKTCEGTVRRVLCLITCSLLAVLVLTAAGCKGGKAGNPSSNGASGGNEFGFGDYDFGGTEILVKTSWPAVWEGGEAQTDAAIRELTERWLREVQKAYNCTVKLEFMTPADTQNSLITRMMSGDHVGDIICTQRLDFERVRLAGDFLLDLSRYSELDLNSNVFNKTLTGAYTYGGKVYACGFSIHDVQSAMHLNMNLLNQLGLEDPQKLALENKWTYEKFIEYCKAATKEDGDGVWDGYDQYGAALFGEGFFTMLNNNGIDICQKQADGTMKYTLNTPNTVDTIKYLSRELVVPGYVVPPAESATVSTINKMFTSGQLLMCPGPYWYAASEFKDTEFELGLLPMPIGPKGSGYTTPYGSWAPAFCIPVTCTKPEMAAALLQSQANLQDIVTGMTMASYRDKTYGNNENAYKVLEMLQNSGYVEYALGEIGLTDPLAILYEAFRYPDDFSIAELLAERDAQIISAVDDAYNKISR